MIKVSKKLVTFGVYFGVIAVIVFGLGWSVLWWSVGGFLGFGFEYVDRLFYVYVNKPHEQLSMHVRQLIMVGRYRDGLRLLRARRSEQRQLTVKSVLFMAVWVPLALFVTTSTSSALAQGFVMGIGLSLLVDLLVDYAQKDQLRQWLFWPIKRYVSDTEIQLVVSVYIVMFCLMNVFLIV